MPQINKVEPLILLMEAFSLAEGAFLSWVRETFLLSVKNATVAIGTPITDLGKKLPAAPGTLVMPNPPRCKAPLCGPYEHGASGISSTMDKGSSSCSSNYFCSLISHRPEAAERETILKKDSKTPGEDRIPAHATCLPGTLCQQRRC